MSKKSSSFLRDIFTDKKTGKIVVGQWPNTPLWIALGLFILGTIQNPDIQLFAKVNMVPVMLYWSYLEIFKGDNTFRRILGLIVAAIFIKNALILLGII